MEGINYSDGASLQSVQLMWLEYSPFDQFVALYIINFVWVLWFVVITYLYLYLINTKPGKCNEFTASGLKVMFVSLFEEVERVETNFGENKIFSF